MKEEIILCDNCKGLGKIHYYLDCDAGMPWSWDEKCLNCDGYGRLLQEVAIKIRKLTKEDLKIKPKE